MEGRRTSILSNNTAAADDAFHGVGRSGSNSSRPWRGAMATVSGQGLKNHLTAATTHHDGNQRSSLNHLSSLGPHQKPLQQSNVFLVDSASQGGDASIVHDAYMQHPPEGHYYSTPSGRSYHKTEQTQIPSYISSHGSHSAIVDFRPSQAEEDNGSDWEGSDAEAYIDFHRTAKYFRTWRNNAYVAKESR